MLNPEKEIAQAHVSEQGKGKFNPVYDGWGILKVYKRTAKVIDSGNPKPEVYSFQIENKSRLDKKNKSHYCCKKISHEKYTFTFNSLSTTVLM